MTSRIETLSYSGLRQALLALTTISALVLGGCAMDTGSKIHPEPIQLVTDNHSQTYVVADLKAYQYDQIADHYSRYGSGEAEIIISYDPLSKKNTAMKASDALQTVLRELNKRGVRNVKSSILAVEHSGNQSEMVVGYNSVTAQAPDGCEMMPGYETGQAAADMATDYQMGCSVKTMVSRQIAHPQDLAGRVQGDSDGDGRRGGVVVDTYRAGTRNGSLGGESASGN